MTLITKLFTDSEAFAQRVGLIESWEEQDKAGAPRSSHENGMYETYDPDYSNLLDFVEKNPQYHIVTVSSYDWSYEVCENNIDGWNDLDEKEQERLMEKHEVSTWAMINAWHFIDRLGYYLAAGDSDPDLYLNEETFVP